jgi:hypothetical protein
MFRTLSTEEKTVKPAKSEIIRVLRYSACLSAVAGVLLAQPHANAKGKPSPPPPPPITSCAGASGTFPSLAYVVPVPGKTKTDPGDTDIYIANSDGTCAIRLFSIANYNYLQHVLLDYRQIGDHGRIIWYQSDPNVARGDPQQFLIEMLDFHISDGAVVESLPLTPSTIYESGSVAIDSTALAADGNTVYYSSEIGTTDSLYEIDISSCSSNCVSSPPFYSANAALWSLSAQGNRVYLETYSYDSSLRTV